MNDGTFRAVVMCKSINFDLMSPQEREAVEFSYQGFLNSLYFPVQIFIRSQKVDLRPYLEKIDKIRTQQDNMLLGMLMQDYLAFLSDIASQTNIMDKKFYMVISYPRRFQKALPRCAILSRPARWSLIAIISSWAPAMPGLTTFMATRASFIPAGCPAWSTWMKLLTYR